jgi:uncharacterized protein
MNMKRWISAITIGLLILGNVARAETPLVEVIKAGDRSKALQLIAKGANVNAAQLDGSTPLLWAAYQVDMELVKALLARGAKAEVRNSLGATPLLEAAKVANLELVNVLLKAGAKPDTANDDNQTPLMLAARTGIAPVVEALIKAGANVNAKEKWREQTALMWAAANSFPDVVELLLAHGAQVNVRAAANDWPNQITSEPRAQYRPTGGLTPLLFAARSGCQRCVAAMLRAGADINMANPDGITPLMNAIDNMKYDVAKYLLDQGANPHTWDGWGRTPLYIAVNARSMGGRLAEAEASGENKISIELMGALLDHGVNPNPQLNMHRPGRGGNSGRFTEDLLTTGATPLLRAAVAHDNDAIEVLLKAGALVDLPNAMGVTPLMAAAGMGLSTRDPLAGTYAAANFQARSIATMEILLKAGADVNARVLDTSGHTGRIARPSSMTNRQGQTALFGAINWGWTDVVKYLLGHGARVDVVDDAGKTLADAVTGNAGGRDHKNVDEIKTLITQALAKTRNQTLQSANK